MGEWANHTDSFSVIRGINRANLTHEVGRRYLMIGQSPSGLQARGSSVTSLCSGSLGGDKPVLCLAKCCPSLASEPTGFYAAAMLVSAVGHLQYILRKDWGIPSVIRPNVKDALYISWSKHFDCALNRGVGGTELANIYRPNRERTRDHVSSKLYQYVVFDSPQRQSFALIMGVTAVNIERAYGRAALAGQALKTGLSRKKSVALGTQLDTHNNRWRDQY